MWTADELRRAGFEPDLVWPQATPPRFLPCTLVAMRREATREQPAPPGLVSTAAGTAR